MSNAEFRLGHRIWPVMSMVRCDAANGNRSNYYGVERRKGIGNMSGAMKLQPGDGDEKNGEVQKTLLYTI